MNTMNLRSGVTSRSCIAFAVMLCSLLAAGCATTSTVQTKPPRLGAFVGTWDGSWTYLERSGGVTTEISPVWTGDKAVVKVLVTTSEGFYEYSVTARFSEGELIYNGKALQMVFKLYGENTLRVPYTHNGWPGEYQLTRRAR